MNGGRAERIEAAVDRLAAAVLAGAAGYAVLVLLNGVYRGIELGVFSAAAAAIGYLLGVRVLRAVAAEEQHFGLAGFELAPIEDVGVEGGSC